VLSSLAITTPTMKFRPCIDVHCGLVKQIVGASLSATGEHAGEENFVSAMPPAHFAALYKRDKLFGGHVIMLGGGGQEQCLEALRAFPGGLQIGGGISVENAEVFLAAGASHVIVTSYIFHDGTIDFNRLSALVALIGKDRLVLDLSCRRKQHITSSDDNNEDVPPPPSDDNYYVVTNKWTQYTDFALTYSNI
jgi:phosphoribosylformimino-5-aminoimidazole carboxamide ribotide isomerase